MELNLDFLDLPSEHDGLGNAVEQLEIPSFSLPPTTKVCNLAYIGGLIAAWLDCGYAIVRDIILL